VTIRVCVKIKLCLPHTYRHIHLGALKLQINCGVGAMGYVEA